MKQKFFLLMSHLLLGGVVFFIVKGQSRPEGGEALSNQADHPSETTPSRSSSGNFHASSSRKPTHSKARRLLTPSAAFRAAWEALPDEKLTTKDRLVAQREILTRWAEVDLEGAMEAAISEGWNDSAKGLNLDNTYLMGPMASALQEAFAKNPAQSWEILQSGRLGLGQSMLRHAWVEAVGKKDPLFLASKLGEISWRERESAIRKIQYSNPSPELKEALFDSLAQHSREVISTEELLKFLPAIPLDDARQELVDITDFDSRKGELVLLRYGQAANQVLSDEAAFKENFAAVETLLEGLPHEAQGKLLHGLLTNFEKGSYYGGQPEKTLTLIEKLMEGAHWEELGQREVSMQFKYGTTGLSEAERAAWVTELPERPETYEIFYRGIEGYIGENMDTAWDWIQDFPADHWRDRALAVYSQEALNKHRDYEASQRALDAMGNPKVRAAAESWRPNWAKAMDGQ